jgi:hypothetical protein
MSHAILGLLIGTRPSAFRSHRARAHDPERQETMRPDYAPMSKLPAPASSRLIDFEKIEIIVLESFPATVGVSG